MTGEWDKHYATLDSPMRYGSTATYALAADWMRPCQTVADWGCGGGGLRAYIELGNPSVDYVGIDGSASPYADICTDLAGNSGALPITEGIVIRHVLEHSYEWEAILANAVDAYTNRMCIVLFTPLVVTTHLLHTEPDYDDVPVIGFRIEDIIDPIRATGAHASFHTYFLDGAHFGTETVIYASRVP